MGGFMPLIEAFLAFALTMLALATAISATVGVWLRLFRWRAFGLRQSLDTIYNVQIAPRLKNARHHEPSDADHLAFIADMTFALNVQAGAHSMDVRDRRVREIENTLPHMLPENALAKAWAFMMRPWRRWHSLRFGVDYLPETQFALRLHGSRAGHELARHYGADEWERLKDHLTEYFTEVGVVATEGFARRSRVRTIIAGLLLAIAVNIDSFDLLNTYMTDEHIRRSVIAQQEEILRQETTISPGREESGEHANYGAKVDAAIARLEQGIVALDQAPDLGDQQQLTELRSALETIRGDLSSVSEASGEIEAAIAATRGIAVSLTKSFPIGWDGYPNCSAATLDLRCARLAARLPGSLGDAEGFRNVLSRVAEVDSAGFLKWLIGVLLTGFMVGLGAPFWVQTVDRILKLKSHVKGNDGDKPADDGPASGTAIRVAARPATPAAAGKGGQVARASADRAGAARTTTAADPDTASAISDR